MRREELVDLNAFATVAEEESFTRAAAKLGTSQSALSHTIRRLETRLGVRLLTRTTRRVAPTQAGERLLRTLRPALDSIAGELMLIGDLREKPAGAIRVTTSEHAAVRVLWPVLDKLLPGYPDINVELSFDSGLTDIGADRFRRRRPARRAGGEGHGGRPHRARPAYAVVGTPSYFARHPKLSTPQDLANHTCINLRLPTAGGSLCIGVRESRERVEGQLVFNNAAMILRAAMAGFGLACVLEDQVRNCLDAGHVIRALEDWCPPFAGHHLHIQAGARTPLPLRCLSTHWGTAAEAHDDPDATERSSTPVHRYKS